MPTWVVVVLMIVAVLAAGMFRERWRISRMETWARQRGVELRSPFAPDERAPMARLAARFEGREPRMWGVGLEGILDGAQVTIAEHETAASGSDVSGSPNTIGVWRVLAAWPRSSGGGAATDSDFRRLNAIGWTHGGELGTDGAWAAWRMRGNLTPALLDAIVAHLPAARRSLE